MADMRHAPCNHGMSTLTQQQDLHSIIARMHVLCTSAILVQQYSNSRTLQEKLPICYDACTKRGTIMQLPGPVLYAAAPRMFYSTSESSTWCHFFKDTAPVGAWHDPPSPPIPHTHTHTHHHEAALHPVYGIHTHRC
jgi:hypothetical protein